MRAKARRESGPLSFLLDVREARLRINGLLLARIHDQPQVPVFIHGQ